MLKMNKKSISKLGNKNPQWAGDDVSIPQLHQWVNRQLIKPDLCEKCGIRKAYDLSNKGIYNRDFKNWEYLCRKCHMESDGRLKSFLKNRRSMPKGNQFYKNVKNRLKGENCPASKLNEEKILEIRKMYATGKYTQQVIADKFDVCFQSISLIVNNKIWRHI